MLIQYNNSSLNWQMQERGVELTLTKHIYPKQTLRILLSLDRTMETNWMSMEVSCQVQILGVFQLETLKMFHPLSQLAMLQLR